MAATIGFPLATDAPRGPESRSNEADGYLEGQGLMPG